jgi:hypothetical protein
VSGGCEKFVRESGRESVDTNNSITVGMSLSLPDDYKHILNTIVNPVFIFILAGYKINN